MFDPYTAELPLPRRMRWESPDRYYVCLLQQDLFDEWEIVRSWGARHDRLGGGDRIPVESYEMGVAKLEEIDKQRQRHRYVPVQAEVR